MNKAQEAWGRVTEGVVPGLCWGEWCPLQRSVRVQVPGTGTSVLVRMPPYLEGGSSQRLVGAPKQYRWRLPRGRGAETEPDLGRRPWGDAVARLHVKELREVRSRVLRGVFGGSPAGLTASVSAVPAARLPRSRLFVITAAPANSRRLP